MAMLVFACITFTVVYFFYADVFLPLWHRLTRKEYGGSGTGSTSANRTHQQQNYSSSNSSSYNSNNSQQVNLQQLYASIPSYNTTESHGRHPGSRAGSNPSSRLNSRMGSRAPSRRPSLDDTQLLSPRQEYGTHLKSPIDNRKVMF
jgi:hypothetical protein